GIQVALLIRLATLYDQPLSKENAKELVIATITGNIGKTLFRQVVKFFPGAGSAAGATIAGAMTFALGHATKYGYEKGINLNSDAFKQLYEEYLAKGKEKFKK